MTTSSLIYILIAAIIAFMVAFFQYYKKKKETNYILLGIRALSVFAILLLLINPKVKKTELTNIKPVLNVLVDNSQSIRFSNEVNSVNDILNTLKSDNSLQDNFDINFYAFSDDLSVKDSFDFNDSQTNILKSLSSLKKINKENGAIILLTDGNQTYGTNYEFFTDKNPIYPIVLGDTTHYNDIRILQVNVNSYANLNNKFPVEVFIQYEGNESVSKVFSVRENTTTVYQEKLNFSKNDNTKRVEFYLNANSVGIHHYYCSIERLSNEKNTSNNQKHFTVEVIDEQAKILILSDVIHPDLGMLKRSIETNKQRKVYVENNLNKNIQLNDYQLVILYQPTNKFKEILAKLITEKHNFLLITGTSTDWQFLNSSQPYLKKNYINRTEEYNANFNPSFDEFLLDDIDFSDLPPLEDIFGSIEFSVPAKTILFQNIQGFNFDSPLLTTFSDTDVKRAVLFGENSWKWRMETYTKNKSYQKFDEFLSKLIQYLSQNKKMDRIEVQYEPIVYANADILFKAQYFDANYVFDPNATLLLKIYNSKNELVKQQPLSLKNNTYISSVPGMEAGSYTFQLTSGTNEKKSGSFTVLDYSIEQQLLTSNMDGLTKLALNTKGKTYYKDQINNLLEEFKNSSLFPVTQKSTEKISSLIDWKWLLFLLVLLLSLEWFIRKYKGLI
jgi:hypothetical protein